MPRRKRKARKVYPVSLRQLAREAELNPKQRVKVGKYLRKIFEKKYV